MRGKQTLLVQPPPVPTKAHGLCRVYGVEGSAPVAAVTTHYASAPLHAGRAAVEGVPGEAVVMETVDEAAAASVPPVCRREQVEVIRGRAVAPP